MSTRALTQTLRRRQIDRSLAEPVLPAAWSTPRPGWIRTVRDAIGMSAAHLAARMGVRQSTVARMEASEQADSITLNSLRRAADALDCTLVYAFVPRRTLEETVRSQALRRARQMVGRVEHTMGLEAQARTPAALDAAVEELAAELVRTLSRELWRDEDAR